MNTKEIQQLFGIEGRVRITSYKKGTKEIVRQTPWFKNLVVSSNNFGRNIICQRLASTNTYSLNLTHGELGSGTTAPTNADVDVETGVKRVATTYKSVTDNVVTLQWFFSDANLANGTYTEFGTFIDGTATLGTGQLFNRVVFGTAHVKAGGEDTTVEVVFTIT